MSEKPAKYQQIKSNQKTIDEINAQLGKIPPQAVDVEEAVLGALMLERDAFINNPVIPEWFYKEEHRKIVSVISELVSESIPIDLLQVTMKLKNKNLLDEVGGPLMIMRLTDKVASAAHIGFHIQIIKEKFARREMIRVASELMQKSYDESIDIDDIFSHAQNELSAVMSFDSEDSSKTYADATDEVIESITSKVEPGIKTGLYKFDKFSGGAQISDLIIIAAESSQGKTSLALSIIRNMSNGSVPVAVYSLEMTSKQLVIRMTAQETGINSKNLLYNRISNDERQYVIPELKKRKNLPVYFDESSNNNVNKICTSLRKLKIKRNIQVALVDYIQDMEGSETEAGIGEIGRKLKNIAKELDICVIALSQLANDKANPAPTVARLRGSGQLREKADVIMLVYRPEYYGKSYIGFFENYPVENTAEITIAKGRNIGVGKFMLNFNKSTTNFYDYHEAEKFDENGNFNPNAGIEPQNESGNDLPF